jgi:hypothetical protein
VAIAASVVPVLNVKSRLRPPLLLGRTPNVEHWYVF